MAEPQVCRTDVMPILAPRCFLSAAIVIVASNGSLANWMTPKTSLPGLRKFIPVIF